MHKSDVQNKWDDNTHIILMYVSMHGQHFQQGMDRPGMVVNPARGQLNNREK